MTWTPLKPQKLLIGTIQTLQLDKSGIPDGFVEANGQSLRVSDFPELAKVVGSNFGSCAPGEFKVPDLRGQFRRETPKTTFADLLRGKGEPLSQAPDRTGEIIQVLKAKD